MFLRKFSKFFLEKFLEFFNESFRSVCLPIAEPAAEAHVLWQAGCPRTPPDDEGDRRAGLQHPMEGLSGAWAGQASLDPWAHRQAERVVF